VCDGDDDDDDDDDDGDGQYTSCCASRIKFQTRHSFLTCLCFVSIGSLSSDECSSFRFMNAYCSPF